MLDVTNAALGCDSEVGRLRAVILHRPGAELQRLTPRNNDALLFDGLPWVAKAQEEHDAFAALLRIPRRRGAAARGPVDRGAVHSGAARMHGIAAAVDSRRLGLPLAQELSTYLRTLEAGPLARVLMAGMTFNELPLSGGELSLVRRMHHGGDFVIDPLPNLLFTRDSSFWIGPRVAITSLALPARVRETSLTDLIYAHHPRFLGVRRAYESRSAPIEGGDVLLLAAGVVAVGVGERTTPAGAEALARSLFDDDLAHTVLAVPIAQERAQMHLDTVCTMVDVDAVVMYPNIVDSLSAFTIHRDGPVECGSTTPRRSWRPPPTRWDRASCGSSTPGWTPSPPSVSSGTTATTRWRWRRAWSSPTSATPKPMPALRMRVSRCCRSRRPSWVPVAAAPAACPAPRPATRSSVCAIST